MVILLSTLTIIALMVATAAVSMALLKPFPIEWLYYHYFIRKPIVWSIFTATSLWIAWETWRTGSVPLWSLLPLFLMGIAVVLTYRLHQEAAFQAVDFPRMADDPGRLPPRPAPRESRAGCALRRVLVLLEALPPIEQAHPRVGRMAVCLPLWLAEAHALVRSKTG
jgi:hypothetical protein